MALAWPRLAAAALLALPASGYFLGEEKGDSGFQKCWKGGQQMVKCPEGFTMDWDLFEGVPYVKGAFVEGQEKDITLDFTWATEGVSYDVVNQNAETPLVPHINLHACKVEEGTCTPLIKANTNTVTHAPAKKGNVMGNYVSTIMLKEGAWTLIAHGRAYLNDTTHYALQSEGCDAGGEVSTGPWKLDVVIGAKVICDPKPRELIEVAAGLRSAAIGINAFFLVLMLAFFGWTAVMKDHVVVKSSAPITILTAIAGGILIVMGALYASIAFDAEVCRCYLMPIIFCIGFWGTFGMAAMKTWRINMIFLRSIELEEFNMSNKALLGCTAAPILLDLILCGIWFIADTPMMERLEDPVNDAVDSMQCSMDNEQIWTYLLILPKVIVLFHIAQIAYKVRDVPDNFNESKALMIGLASSTMLFMVFFILGVLLKLPLEQKFLSATIGIPLAFVLNVVIVVGAKILNIYVTKDFENKEKNDILKFITNAKSKATGMSSMASGMSSMASGMESGMSGAESGMSALDEEAADPELTKLEEELEKLKEELRASKK